MRFLFSFLTLISIFSFRLLAVTADSSAVKTTREKLVVEVDEAALAALPAEGREAFQLLLQSLRDLERVTDIEIEFPPSLFEGQTEPLVRVSDLMVAPDFSAEMKSLAGVALSPQQQADIFATSTYRIVSPSTGKVYVWKLPAIAQRGDNAIRISIDTNITESLYEFRVQIPNVIVGKSSISMRQGLSKAGRSLRSIFDLLLGVKQQVRAYSEAEVLSQYEEAKEKFIGARLLRNQNFDLRLFNLAEKDQKRIEKIHSVVAQISNRVDTAWNADLDKLEDLSADEMIRQKNLRFLAALKSSEELEAIEPGLAELVAKNSEAQWMIGNIEIDLGSDKKEKLEKKREQLIKENPLLSQMRGTADDLSWLDQQLQLEAQRIDHEQLLLRSDKIPNALSLAGLDQAAAIYKLGLEFDTGEGSETLKALVEKQRPAIARSFQLLKGWDPEKWIERGEDGKYFLNPYIVKTVTSDKNWWRLDTLRRRYQWSVSSFAYDLIYRNLYQGPLGWRSLVEDIPFSNSWIVNQNGQLEADENPRKKVSTLRSNLRGISEYIAKEKEDFKTRERGAIGRVFSRAALAVFTQFGVGFLGRTAVVGGRPIAFALNSIVSGVCTGACMLGIGTIVPWAFNATIYNFEDKPFEREGRGIWGRARHGMMHFLSRVFPPLTQVVLPLSAGVIETVAAPVVGLPYHALKGTAYAANAYIVHDRLSRGWDRAMRPLIKRGSTVSKDQSWGEKLVAGPGMASEFFFLVKPELILLALRAQLEYAEAERLSNLAFSESSEPKRKVANLLVGIELLFGKSNFANNGLVSNQLEKDSEKNRTKLQEILKAQRSKYGSLLDIKNREAVRLMESDLTNVLQTGSALAQAYYEKLMLTWLDEERATFWKNLNLKENDWLGLVKATLVQIFPGILQSQEATDDQVILEISTPGLSEVLSGILSDVDLSNLGERFYISAGNTKTDSNDGKISNISLTPSSVCGLSVRKLVTIRR